MPYEPHVRVVWSGGLGTNTPNPEEFSFSLNLVVPVGVDQVLCNDLHAAASDLFASPTSKIGSHAELQLCKVAHVDDTGHVDGTVFTNDSTQDGGTGGVVLPFQCSLAVSLRTGERGPSKRGRFYLPATATHPNATNGEIDSAVRDGIAEDVGLFLQAVTESGAGGNTIVVASQVVGNTEVTHYQVGRVIDTIRRRRRSLDENYGALLEIPVTPP